MKQDDQTTQEWIAARARERHARHLEKQEAKAEAIVGLGILLVILTLIVGAIVAACTGHEGVAFVCVLALFMLFG